MGIGLIGLEIGPVELEKPHQARDRSQRARDRSHRAVLKINNARRTVLARVSGLVFGQRPQRADVL